MDLLFAHPLVSDETIRALCWTLVHSLWEGLLMALLAAIVLFFTKKSPAVLRYNLLAMLFGLFAGSVCFTFVNQQGEQLQLSHDQMITTFDGSINAQPAVHTGQLIEEALNWNFTSALNEFFNTHAALIVAIWSLVFFLKCLKITFELRLVQHLRRHGTLAPPSAWQQKLDTLCGRLNIRHPVTLLESGRIRVPSVAGILKPVILLPLGLLAQLPADQIEAILLHELAHIRRRDYLVNLLQHFTETLFFFNPAVLWVSALLREERENCCDDIAVSALNNKSNYLNALLSFEKFSQESAGYALAFPGKKGQLLNRVKRIIGNHHSKTLSIMEKITLIISVLIVGAIALLPITDVQAQAKQAQKNPTVSNINVMGEGTAADPQQMTIKDTEGKTYKVKRVDRKVLELYVNDQKVPDDQIAQYDEMINTVDAQIQEDMEQAKQDKLQAEQDALQAQQDKLEAEQDERQAEQDQLQAERDAQQAKLDAEQAKRDGEQAKRDAQQAKLDAEQAKRDGEQAKRDAQQAKLDAQQAKLDAQQAKREAAEDRQRIENVTNDILRDHILNDKSSLVSFKITESEFVVNGQKQPEEMFKKYKVKYLKNKGYGMYYGYKNVNGYGLFLNGEGN